MHLVLSSVISLACVPRWGRAGARTAVFCLPVCGHTRLPLRLPVRVEPGSAVQAARIFSMHQSTKGIGLSFVDATQLGSYGKGHPWPPVVTRRGSRYASSP